MTPDEARALIAEGRKHDEAMSKAHWTYSPTSGKIDAPNGGPNQYLSKTVCELFSMNHLANGNGIAWMRTNLRALLDGYAEVLAENVELSKRPLRTFDHVGGDRLADEVAVLIRRRVIDARSPAGDALLDYRDPPPTERSDRMAELEREIERLRVEVARLRASSQEAEAAAFGAIGGKP